MEDMVKNLARRTSWLLFALGAAFAAAALRRWQLSSAFEEGTGLAIRRAQPSVILVCLLFAAAAWFLLCALHRPMAVRAPVQRWDQVFLDTGDPIYPILVVLGAFLALAAAPFLFRMGMGQWTLYQQALAARAENPNVQLPSSNGVLTLATAAGALLTFWGLLRMGRDAFHPGRRGRGGYSALLPGVAGCVWLMESFRAHAANPVRWDYAPLLLAIVCGMLFYMEMAGMSAGTGRPGRLLWLAAMTMVMSAPALVSSLAEKSLFDVLLLFAQTLAAAAVLWRLPAGLDSAPRPPQSEETSIQEETTDE